MCGSCTPSPEVCNGCDDDLDGAVDETFSCVQDTVEPCLVTACGTPGNTCFCASMDTGPSPEPSAGQDLTVTELRGNDRPADAGCQNS